MFIFQFSRGSRENNQTQEQLSNQSQNALTRISHQMQNEIRPILIQFERTRGSLDQNVLDSIVGFCQRADEIPLQNRQENAHLAGRVIQGVLNFSIQIRNRNGAYVPARVNLGEILQNHREFIQRPQDLTFLANFYSNRQTQRDQDNVNCIAINDAITIVNRSGINRAREQDTYFRAIEDVANPLREIYLTHLNDIRFVSIRKGLNRILSNENYQRTLRPMIENLNLARDLMQNDPDLSRIHGRYQQVFNGEFDFEMQINIAYGLGVLGQERMIRLTREQGITHFLRYRAETLIEAAQNLDQRNDSRGIFVIIGARSDDKGAFYANEQTVAAISSRYRIIIYEVENENEFFSSLRNARNRFGRLSGLLISGHGSTNGIRFGYQESEENFLDITDLEQMRLGFRDIFENNAKIILGSCQTGRIVNEQNQFAFPIGQHLSDAAPNTTVFAPSREATGAIQVTFNQNNQIEQAIFRIEIGEEVLADDRNIFRNGAVIDQGVFQSLNPPRIQNIIPQRSNRGRRVVNDFDE